MRRLARLAVVVLAALPLVGMRDELVVPALAVAAAYFLMGLVLWPVWNDTSR